MKAVKKRVGYTATLPQPIAHALQGSDLSRQHKSRAVKFISIILHRITSWDNEIDDYHTIASDYFRKVFKDARYNTWLNKLKELGVIQVYRGMSGFKEEFSISDKVAKAYRINPDLLSDDFVPVQYEILEAPDEEKTVLIGNEEWNVDFLAADYQSLVFSKRALLASAKNIVNNISLDDFQLNEDIKDHRIERVIDTSTGYVGRSTLQKCLKQAKGCGMDFIKSSSGKFYIKKAEQFLLDKRRHTYNAYTYAIDKLCSGDIYFKRDGKNTRLNHNFTSFHKGLLAVIIADNNLVEIDLCNSQFAILAYMMVHDEDFISTTDFEIFKTEAGNGTLYLYIAEQLQMEVSIVKQMMMEVSFSSERNNSRGKKLLKQLFPSVIAYIDRFKIEAGESNQFALALQDLEAYIFVDKMYNQLKRDGLFCLTKHDSLIVRKEDVIQVTDFMRGFFEQAAFECAFKGGVVKHNI